MSGDLLTKDGLRNLEIRCGLLAKQVSERERELVLLAEKQFRNAAKCFDEPDSFWWRQYAIGGLNSLKIAKISAYHRLEEDSEYKKIIDQYSHIME